MGKGMGVSAPAGQAWWERGSSCSRTGDGLLPQSRGRGGKAVVATVDASEVNQGRGRRCP